jgi:hypothetical protein
VRVHPQESEALKLPEGSILTSCRVADGETPDVDGAEEEEAVAGGLHIEQGVAKPRDGLQLVGGGNPCPVVERDDV